MKDPLYTDIFSLHEVLHTAYVFHSIWCDHILNHAAVDSNPTLKSSASKISDDLWNFYQLVANEKV